jgi:hypothetical protein
MAECIALLEGSRHRGTVTIVRETPCGPISKPQVSSVTVAVYATMSNDFASQQTHPADQCANTAPDPRCAATRKCQ